MSSVISVGGVSARIEQVTLQALAVTAIGILEGRQDTLAVATYLLDGALQLTVIVSEVLSAE